MLFNLFNKTSKNNKANSIENSSSAQTSTKTIERYSLQEQQQLQTKRKRLVIDEFGKSLINLQLEHGVYIPLYIVDIHEVPLNKNKDYKQLVAQEFQKSYEIHKNNLRQSIYRKSFYFQPAELLIVLKNERGETVLALKYLRENVKKLIKYLNEGIYSPSSHRLLLVRYFIPPIPDDLYKVDNIKVPPKFEEAVRDIVNYCDLHYSAKNMTYQKWKNLLEGLNVFGLILKFPDSDKSQEIISLLTDDYSHLGYHRIKVEEIVKDTVEKNPVVLPLFVILLAFFCSDKSEDSRFPYNLLFTPTGDNKKFFLDKGETTFFNLFNKLMDESLLPNQFRKCLSTIYYEAFMLNQAEIDDMLFLFREEYNQKHSEKDNSEGQTRQFQRI